jgi:Uma2 family endonuclease
MDGDQNIFGALHRFTVEDYHRMSEAGVFPIGTRVELIRGAVVDMPAIGTPHLWTVNRLTKIFAPLVVAGRAILSVQNSIRLGNHSEPQPDVALLTADADPTEHPGPPDVLLVIEVSDRTLDQDRKVKAALYAESALPEYWIVNLVERVVEVHRQPRDGAYRQIDRVSSGTLPIQALPGVEVALAQVLPPAD